MPETLTKLRPDRDLQCYFQTPAAIAALSGASADGFTVSGNWRQQFDWAVIEWNRDNPTGHPDLRNLPDGNLKGLTLGYEEERTNCIPIDSKTFDAIGWSYLRVWEEHDGSEHFHWVPLLNYATPVEGSYVPATCHFELGGTATSGDVIELVWLNEHANATVGASLPVALADLAGFINAKSNPIVTAAATDTGITLTYTGALGVNGNRIGVYGGVSGAKTEVWSPASATFGGGASPTKWRVYLNFANLTDTDGQIVNTSNVRKLRWTWAPELQWTEFGSAEFSTTVTKWTLAGTGLSYQVAGAGSRRIQDDDSACVFSTGPLTWIEERGNYSGGSARYTTVPGAHMECSYTFPVTHQLYLGTRYLGAGTGELLQANVQVDGGPISVIDLKRPTEDGLVRVPLGERAGGVAHTVRVTNTGTVGKKLYIDFLEMAVPTTALPEFTSATTLTLATDWDTAHSLPVAPERTAWLVQKLGFTGRANHYAGALWFYNLVSSGNVYARATVTFSGDPLFGDSTTVTLAGTPIIHTNFSTDTAASIAKAFEILINAGVSVLWAVADGPVLTIVAREPGEAGNELTLSVSPDGSTEGPFTAIASGSHLTGGTDGKWLVDLATIPRLNRAARDWHKAYFAAMHSYNIPVTAALSMELGQGDDSLEAGIAQRYPDGPVILNTPALQTNFSPTSQAYWRQAFKDMAGLMASAGVTPYLQFGETQWWYFANASGMTFYDDYTKSAFQATYGRPLPLIPSENTSPSGYAEETAFLSGLIGQFTTSVMAFVRQTYPDARFEVLYPPDTNNTALNRAVNYPEGSWTPSTLACLKTESFTYTGDRNLDLAMSSIRFSGEMSFPPSQSSHLIGIGEYTTPWVKEHLLALGAGLESVVLFALDQFCLIGYALPVGQGPRRSLFMGH